MSLLLPIARRSPRVRLLYGFMYVLLGVGAISMVYPFALMISGSMKSHVDIRHHDVIPAFLRDDVWLYRKHMEGLFNEDLLNLQQAYGSDATSFERLNPPDQIDQDKVTFYREFLEKQELPVYAISTGYFDTPNTRTLPAHLRGFKRHLKDSFGADIASVNTALDTDFAGWSSVVIRPRRYLSRRVLPVSTPLDVSMQEYQENSVPLEDCYIQTLEGFYLHAYLKSRFGRDVQQYNAACETSYESWDEIRLADRVPSDAGERAEWERFVREVVGLQFVRLDPAVETAYREYLKARHGEIRFLNRNYESKYTSFEAVPLPGSMPDGGARLTDWAAFIRGWQDPQPDGALHAAALEAVRLDSIDLRYRAHAEAAGYRGLDARMPQEAFHYSAFLATRDVLRREFVGRNYKAVSEYLIFHGRGVYNTVVYCLLAVLSALLINPLAAYAMSRYRLPKTYSILLFMLCTMAFPPMVTAIPNFLMLRNLGLLNTFAALVLPVMANGYAIFLLKGFFDSQPRELYESAQLDGAGEWTMFWQLTMRLSKPILAVIALQAFNLAYSDFMFAFVVCQDEKMWTLMVWLYQLQQRSGQGVVYASLMIAAIPTFLIFLFCQNIIMRGIVVPSEK